VDHRLEARTGPGAVTITAAVAHAEEDLGSTPGRHWPSSSKLVQWTGRAGGSDRSDLQSVLHTKTTGTAGLAIVSKIVDAHDGRIDVAQRATGTRFRRRHDERDGWFK
jgi:hypothetical protein